MASTGLGDSYRQSLRDSLRAMRLLPPGAWCLLTPDHSESLEPFAHTISDNMLHSVPPAAWLAAHNQNAALELGKAAPTVSLLRPRTMDDAICVSIPVQDFSYHVPHSWSHISIHDFCVDRRIGWSSPTADQSLHIAAQVLETAAPRHGCEAVVRRWFF